MSKKTNVSSGKQRSPSEKRSQIARSAIDIIATHGMDGLTHRDVAKAAGVSLGLTTYYFENKFDIIAEACRITLQHYENRSQEILCNLKNKSSDIENFHDFVLNLVVNHTTDSRSQSLCWFEIVFDSRKHPDKFSLAPDWFERFRYLWIEIGVVSGNPLSEIQASSVVDVVIGLSMIGIALGLSPEQITDVLNDGKDPFTTWEIENNTHSDELFPEKTRIRSLETRNKIVEVTIDALVSEGVGAVVYRSIADRAGLTIGGPFYHFPTINSLIQAARSKLLMDCNARRTIKVDARTANLAYLVDLIAMIFLRELTEFVNPNLAYYMTWTDAGRNPQLRPLIWRMMSDHLRNWKALLEGLSPRCRNIDSVIIEAIFIGKFVRILGTGVRNDDLVNIRREFTHDLKALIGGSFWM